jgi:outer membrane protein
MNSWNKLVIFVAFAGRLEAQSLTLAEAVNQALHNYPSLKVSQEQINASAAAIQLARTAYLPRVDMLAQANRATRNNVFGVLLPQNVIPSMSGPVIGSNNFGSVWGSAIGGLVTWEPFDFGLRSAGVAAANAAKTQQEAAAKKTELEVAAATADAYVTLTAARETVRAAQAGVDRAEVVVKVIGAQVGAQLRPGADQSRAEAELAAARSQLIQAQQAVEVSQATLAQFTGSLLETAPGALLELPPEEAPVPVNPAVNPTLVEQSAVIEQARAQLHTLERSYFPRFYLQGAAYSRGTGAEVNGVRLSGLNGLAPNYQDYAVGFSVSFPVMDFAAIRAKEAAQSATIRGQAAKAEQLALELRAQWSRAVAMVHGARRIAANTPVEVQSAHAAVEQATARYQAGLGTIDDVAEAHRLLTQAEIDNALARLSVWRGLLGIAIAAGDLQPFIAEASR